MLLIKFFELKHEKTDIFWEIIKNNKKLNYYLLLFINEY